MVTAAAGSDAAVVLVDATKLDLARDAARSCCRRRAATRCSRSCCACRTSSSPSTSSTPSPTRRRRSRAFAPRSLAFAAEAGFAPAGIVPISALHGDNVSRPSALGGYDGPTLARAARAAARRRRRDRRRRAAAGAVRRRRRRQRRRPPAARAVGPRRARRGRGRRRRSQVFPSGETARVAELHVAGARVDARRRGPLGRRRPRSPARRLARRLARGARQRRADARAFAPRSPGSTPSRRSSAASTGCATATAGCTAASPRSTAGSTSRRSPRTKRTSSASTRSARSIVETQQPLPLARFADDRVAGALLVVDPATQPDQRHAARARLAGVATAVILSEALSERRRGGDRHFTL